MTDPKTMTAEEALGIIQVWNFIPDEWEMPLGFNELVAQAKDALSVLSSLAEENAALKAEVERLTVEAKHHTKVFCETVTDLGAAIARAEKAEAELDAARPLINAVKQCGGDIHGVRVVLDETARFLDRSLADAEGKVTP